jgi:hypothetical protein
MSHHVLTCALLAVVLFTVCWGFALLFAGVSVYCGSIVCWWFFAAVFFLLWALCVVCFSATGLQVYTAHVYAPCTVAAGMDIAPSAATRRP